MCNDYRLKVAAVTIRSAKSDVFTSPSRPSRTKPIKVLPKKVKVGQKKLKSCRKSRSRTKKVDAVPKQVEVSFRWLRLEVVS